MEHSIQINSSDEAFDAFVDDCLVEKDPICNNAEQNNLQLVASQIMQGLWEVDDVIAA